MREGKDRDECIQYQKLELSSFGGGGGGEVGITPVILTEDTSTGNKKMMTKLKNQTNRVQPVTNGFCFLKFPYL